MRQNGIQSQLTGERAETKVRNALLDASLCCSKLEIDRGEDLLVEIDGYVKQAENCFEPRIGLLQIKGHEADHNSPIENNKVKRRLELTHLRRWAAYPLPVFVIAVEICNDIPYFYALSIDKLVGEFAPDGLASLEQNTVTASLPKVMDLADFLKEEIAGFYSHHAFRLSGLSESILARNHYEILSKKTFTTPAASKILNLNISVLWKGPWRPAHFWATLNHIADQLKLKEGGKNLPLMAAIHVYRSLKDQRDNNAIAHVSWLEDDHAGTNSLKEQITWPKALHWSRFRIHGPLALDTLPTSYIVEEGDEGFIAKVEAAWAQLDAIYLEVITELTHGLQLNEDKLASLVNAITKLDDQEINKIGRPSPHLTILDRMLTQYSDTLTGVLTWQKGKADISELTRQRWLQQDLDLAQGHFRAFYPLIKLLK